MAYDANNAKVLETNKFPKDSVLDGIIINLEDGVVSQFISESAKQKWDGDLSSNAILVTVQVKLDDEQSENFDQMFTYIDQEGETFYTENSNIGKFHKKYGSLPVLEQKVKVMTNSDGFAKIKID